MDPVCIDVSELNSAQTGCSHLLFLKVQMNQEVKNRTVLICSTFDYYKILSDKNINLLAGRKHFKGMTDNKSLQEVVKNSV